MSPTKIINVLNDDKFEDILDIFKKTSAQEVIFVLPKNCRSFSSEDNFVILADEASQNNKDILIMSSSKELNNLALKHNLGVLTSSKHNLSSSDKDAPDIEEEKQDNIDQETILTEEEIETENSIHVEDRAVENIYYSNAQLASAGRAMVDIIKPDEDGVVNIPISKKSEQSFKVNIKKDPIRKQNSQIMNDIENVWLSKPWPKNFTIGKHKTNFSFKFQPFNLPKKTPMFLGATALIILGAVIYISTGSAHIIIKPRSHDLEFNLKLHVSSEFQSISTELKNIPGQLFSVEKKIEETFQATGERDVVQKARGVITVYNGYGTTPQILIATTRFQAENDLIFKTLKTITIPGTQVKNGEITPGSIDVEVIADRAGEIYNINSGKFTIPAFKERGDLDRYGKFYGVSKMPMKGGIIGKAKVVTDEDYISARNKIGERLVAEAKEELNIKTAGLRILNSLEPEIKEIISSAKIDEAVETFQVSGSARLETVGFKESDLDALIIQYVNELHNLKVLPEKLKMDFSDIKFNKTDKTLEFVLLVSGSAYSKIDEGKIVSDLSGKNEEQIKVHIRGINDIVSAKVVLSPFWVYKMPQNKEKVKLEIQY